MSKNRTVEAQNRASTMESLTTEQLRGMDGMPVWIEIDGSSCGAWGILDSSCIIFKRGLMVSIALCGKSYKAYTYNPAHIA